MELQGGRTTLQSVEHSISKALWNCRKTRYVMNVTANVSLFCRQAYFARNLQHLAYLLFIKM